MVILTLLRGGRAFTLDNFRYTASHHPDTDVWELRISNVSMTDSGVFECQVPIDIDKTEVLTLMCDFSIYPMNFQKKHFFGFIVFLVDLEGAGSINL